VYSRIKFNEISVIFAVQTVFVRFFVENKFMFLFCSGSVNNFRIFVHMVVHICKNIIADSGQQLISSINLLSAHAGHPAITAMTPDLRC